MKIRLSEQELNRCISNVASRILREAFDDEEEDEILVGDDSDDYEDEDDSDVDFLLQGDNTITKPFFNDDDFVDDEKNDNASYDNETLLPGEQELDGYEVETDIEPAEDSLIADIEEMFGIESDVNTRTGNVMFRVPATQLEKFKAYAAQNDIEIIENGNALNESKVMPCEPFKINTNGEVFWMRESKPVENVDLFRFRLDESYRRECWNNYVDGKFVM